MGADLVDSVSCSASSKPQFAKLLPLLQQRARSRGPTQRTRAQWSLSSPGGPSARRSHLHAAKEQETPTLVMIKGWLKSRPPESLNPQGAGPGRTTFWGMLSGGAAFLGWGHLGSQELGRSEARPCPQRVSPSPRVHYAPGQSSLPTWTAAGELYPHSGVTSAT